MSKDIPEFTNNFVEIADSLCTPVISFTELTQRFAGNLNRPIACELSDLIRQVIVRVSSSTSPIAIEQLLTTSQRSLAALCSTNRDPGFVDRALEPRVSKLNVFDKIDIVVEKGS